MQVFAVRRVRRETNSSVKYAQGGPVLEGMHKEAHRIEKAAQRPDVGLLSERAPHVKVHHLGGTVHLGGLLRYVLLRCSPLFRIANINRRFGARSEVAKADPTVLQQQ